MNHNYPVELQPRSNNISAICLRMHEIPLLIYKILMILCWVLFYNPCEPVLRVKTVLFVHIVEVEVILQDLENIKVKGKNAPKPIKTWAQVKRFSINY